ncbi:MAG: hypothetical protein L0216_01525 [Planctomycetales bacterium]|nr:hypothetical protein [Planctomycetales bacterium]
MILWLDSIRPSAKTETVFQQQALIMADVVWWTKVGLAGTLAGLSFTGALAVGWLRSALAYEGCAYCRSRDIVPFTSIRAREILARRKDLGAGDALEDQDAEPIASPPSSTRPRDD